ncbi:MULTISPECIES: ribonuclease III [unclassified Alteromonas]|uniref:ribonuclease III n=1 Tax=unclassified Alteromonas TaxID=2614992 RepID=UPI000E6A9115|nr:MULTISPECIES: ribonuclease III [unclassified Alteromonas]AYA65079.1 ribonuclease III [Alteromonas sp. RKMC-009]MDO6475031.1 ribonuclease III [Alteromonas sp. 1_MG-2023]MEC7690318.1 ribonuclease III [Pseudomonadota bacterium]
MQGIDRYARLSKLLDYRFKDEGLLEQALTHRSAAKKHNERLEFLGDAVLGMVIADALFARFPSVPEGKLTRMRSTLVKGDTLAEMAKEAGVGELLKLGQGELKSGGHRRSSILADAVEAILGAIYLDAGIDTVSKVILSLWSARIDRLDPNEHPKDSKTRLQEYLQSRREPLPVYEVVGISGKDHAQTFEVSCTVAQLEKPVFGTGNSRRKAEQQAAKETLEKLEHASE